MMMMMMLLSSLLCKNLLKPFTAFRASDKEKIVTFSDLIKSSFQRRLGNQTDFWIGLTLATMFPIQNPRG